MAEVKKRFLGLSEWLTYELETDAIEPPVLKVRVRPIQKISTVDMLAAGKDAKLSEYIFYAVIEAVAEWDLTEGGVPIPPTRENKLLHLGPRMSDMVKSEGALLGLVLFNWATDQENFLKN